MDFTDAVVFIASVFVIVAAGAVLGWGLARSRKQANASDVVPVYRQLIGSMDGLRAANDDHKKVFIEGYYAALVYAPDEVISPLNTFLQASTKTDGEYDPSVVSAARDLAVAAMRKHIQGLQGQGSKLSAADLYSIEISRGDPGEVIKPQSELSTSPPAPTPVPETPSSNL